MKCLFKSIALLTGVLVLVSFMQSCNSVKPIEKTKLENSVWVLKALKGEAAQTVFTEKLPDLKFDFAKNTLSGSGGCNQYTGGFTLSEKNEFSAPNIVATLMACLSANKEPEYLSALSIPNLKVALINDSLLTFSEGERTVLEFIKSEITMAAYDNKVVDPEDIYGKWVISSIPGEDISTLFADRPASMEILAEGRVSGNAGCNRYQTTFKLEKNVMTFGPAMATKMACPGLNGETLFLSKLAKPLTVTIEADKLILLNEGNVELEFVKDTNAQ